jgi:DNA (cytosine-5)-methyltransferase 1
MARIIGEVGPRYRVRGKRPQCSLLADLDVFSETLAAMGYDARWGVLGAVDAGAPHKREQNLDCGRRQKLGCEAGDLPGRPAASTTWSEHKWPTRWRAQVLEIMADTGSERGQLSAGRELAAVEKPWIDSASRSSGRIAGEWWSTEPAVGRVANGVAARVDRLKAIGNGQVPAVAALAWNVLKPIPERLVVHPVP